MPREYKILFRVFIFLSLSVFYFISPNHCQAASLYIEPASADYRLGEIFNQEIKVDNQGEDLNAFEIHLQYPSDLLEIKDINFANSILSFIVNQPEINQEQGSLYFSGIVPGGYSGRVMGDPGAGNLLTVITYQVKKNLTEKKTAIVYFNEQTKILLNDGQATLTEVKKNEARFEIYPLIIEEDNNQPVEKDITFPELYQPEISRSNNIFNNQWFLSFFAQDKDSGIEYYEVQESINNKPDEGKWIKIEMAPYLLTDQTLASYIFLRAVDQAGNKKMIVVSPSFSSSSNKVFTRYIIYVIIIIALLIAIFLVLKRLTKRKNRFSIN